MNLSGSDNSLDSIGSPDGSFAKLWGTESALMRGLKDGKFSRKVESLHWLRPTASGTHHHDCNTRTDMYYWYTVGVGVQWSVQYTCTCKI